MTQYQLFDLLGDDEFQSLKADIAQRGVLVPIEFDTEGSLLDGHHRKRACDELGITDYPTVVRHFASDDEREEHVVTLNVRRRHLTGEQKRHWAGWFLRRHPDWSNRKIASEVGLTDPTVADERRKLEAAGEVRKLSTRVGRDGIAQPAHKPAVFGPAAEQERAQEALSLIADKQPDKPLKSATMTPAEARKTAARLREPEPVTDPVPMPDGIYSTIVIDPPWPMPKIERDERPDQGAKLDYPTMPVFCEMAGQYIAEDHWEGQRDRYQPDHMFWCEPIDDPDQDDEPCRSIQCVVGHLLDSAAAKDCHLYLWVTHKFMPDSLALLESWGFNYQCVMTWRKNVGITPFSWMYDTEHVLFARRGNLPLTQLGLRLSFDAKVQGHSRKPSEFYERVALASPGPRLDVFARTPRDGFAVWGNEVVSDAS